MMRVIESLTCGKTGDESLNEDRLVVTDAFIAVLDGVTSKTTAMIEGKTGGRFAVELAESAIEGFPDDISAREAVDELSRILKRAAVELPAGFERPGFAMAVYSARRRQVWRLSDPWIVLDGKIFAQRNALDEVNANTRALALEMAVRQGESIESLLRHDPGRACIAPFLKDQHLFANREGPYGYAVINGDDVPDSLINIVDAAGAREIILASDGYPQVFPTLEESEKRLAEILRKDPLLFRDYKSTKGLVPGNLSFDDRTYVRFSS